MALLAPTIQKATGHNELTAQGLSFSVAFRSADFASTHWNTPGRTVSFGSQSLDTQIMVCRLAKIACSSSGSHPWRHGRRPASFVFRSATTILETFGLPEHGRYYRRLIAGFERIFYSTFFLTSDDQNAETAIITRTSFRFVSTLKLWYVRGTPPDQERDSNPNENISVLSEEFWNEIQGHPFPVDLNVVRAIADSPGNLDLYIWLVWRSWTAKTQVNVPLFGPEGLVAQLGNSDSLRERDFRRQISRWLQITRQLWPECTATMAESGTSLILQPTRKVPGAQ
jgi:hypothetical protein